MYVASYIAMVKCHKLDNNNIQINSMENTQILWQKASRHLTCIQAARGLRLTSDFSYFSVEFVPFLYWDFFEGIGKIPLNNLLC